MAHGTGKMPVAPRGIDRGCKQLPYWSSTTTVVASNHPTVAPPQPWLQATTLLELHHGLIVAGGDGVTGRDDEEIALVPIAGDELIQ